jgi:hypothetical protein
MEADEGSKKHPCPDCTFCQWCSDDRCRMCRAPKACCRKLSSAEQIELYERMNAENGKKS